jgi:beta-N-acetylhexosaminidase
MCGPEDDRPAQSAPHRFRRQGAAHHSRTLLQVGALLALVGLLLTACGRSNQTAADRVWNTPQPSAADLAVGAQLARAQMAQALAVRQHQVLEKAVDWYLARMSLDEQLGQLLLNACNCGRTPDYTNDLAYMVERQHIGGIILYGDSLNSFVGTQRMDRTIQARAALPLFVGTDQEGSWVSRVTQFFGSFPSARDLANSGDPKYAYGWGRQTGLDLKELGINTDFAPVVDVPVNGGGFWGPWRTFSDDPKQVARFAGAFMAGLQSVGEVACLKHYPGIGSVTADPHDTLPVITRSLSQFQQSELHPYQALIPQSPDMIMATDVLAPAVDPVYPAELSPKWIDGVLRHQLGYDGVIMTDALWMKGILAQWSATEAAVLAVLAGSDIVLAAWDSSSTQSVLDALKAAIASGRLTRARVAQSVRRILTVKITHGLLPIPPQVFPADHLMSA